MTKPGPGKFENNQSAEVAEALYDILVREIAARGKPGDQGAHDIGLVVNRAPAGPLTAPAYIIDDNHDEDRFDYVRFDSEVAARETLARIVAVEQFGFRVIYT